MVVLLFNAVRDGGGADQLLSSGSVFFKRAGTPPTDDYEARLLEGRYVGHHTRTNAALIMTTRGVVRACGFNRRPASER